MKLYKIQCDILVRAYSEQQASEKFFEAISPAIAVGNGVISASRSEPVLVQENKTDDLEEV